MKKLKIHYIQHVPFEGLGTIAKWAELKGHSVNCTKLYANDSFPLITDFDWLIIMGGPMSVNDNDKFRWLNDEILFIKEAIDAGKQVLGICLGAQLVSKALGAKVYSNGEKEIGWFDINIHHNAASSHLLEGIGRELKVFHWHGETFDLPTGAVLFASSEGCKNQAYIYNNKVIAFQFHLESDINSLQLMINNCKAELVPGRYIQMLPEELIDADNIEVNSKILFTLLDRMNT